MSKEQIEILQQALEKEKAARKQAEKKLETKTAEFLKANQKLKKTNKELEELFLSRDTQLQGVFESIVEPYIIMDLAGNIMKMNEAAVAMFDFKNTKEDCNLNSILHPSETTRVLESYQILYKEGQLTNFTLKIITRKKRHILIQINANIIYDKGKPVAAQGIVRDITQEKANEEQLLESKNRLSTLVNNLDNGVLLEDENHRIISSNKKFTELFSLGVPPEELQGLSNIEVFKQKSHLLTKPEAFLNNIQSISQKKETVFSEVIEFKNGKILELNYLPIAQANQSKGSLWTFKDITLIRTYLKRLEIEQQKYYSIISNINLGLIEVDTENVILMVNDSFLSMTGYKEEELVGIKGKNLLPIKEDLDLVKKKLEERKKGKIESYELRIKNKQGEIRYWMASGAPNYDLEGNITGSIGVYYDITEIKKLQNQKENLLLKLEKRNEELQEYAHIVSHDLKSPLRSVSALVSWLKEDNKGKLDNASIQNFSLIESTVEKMEQLITDILEYSSIGSEEIEKSDVNINTVVTDLIQMLFIPEHISVNVLSKLPIIKGNKTKLQQLFQNLISNAVKFIDKEVGIIDINVKELSTHYKFCIKDNGIGIEKKFHHKIFRIFNTLNKSEDSTGIGLSIVKKIVELHEGKIWLESEPNIGTTFYFTLKKQ
ncbi:PAS domain-containing sensor histidine kinase [Gelatiniphilus marinus]|uniref:histidine kinase n=1 Tax=Gelatiniphilus marinus TaxID=1759464 RepID=A0ABW5JW38_9FLAO